MSLDPIGVIGSGPLASAIAQRLAGGSMGSRVITHGISAPEHAGMTSKARSRVEPAANLFDLASECEAVFCAYPSQADLQVALTGSTDRPGLLGGFQPGSILIDFTPGAPDDCAKLAGQLSGGAIGYVEGTLLGDLDDPSDEKATVYLGGYAEHIERVKPALIGFAHCHRIGAQGHSRVLIALIEAKAAVDAALEAELMAIGATYSLDAQTLSDALFARLGPPDGETDAAVALANARHLHVPLLESLRQKPDEPPA